MSSSFELEAQKLKLSPTPARIKPINYNQVIKTDPKTKSSNVKTVIKSNNKNIKPLKLKNIPDNNSDNMTEWNNDDIKKDIIKENSYSDARSENNETKLWHDNNSSPTQTYLKEDDF